MVTVIIPCYNSSNSIIVCINSILDQTYKNLEIILIDDGSTDGTLSILKSFDDPRIKVLPQSHKGPGEARILGINNASGEYILLVDSDDYIEPDCVQTLLDNFTEGIDAISYNAMLHVYSTNDIIIGRVKDIVINPTIKDTANCTNFLCSIFTKTETWKNLGPSPLPFREDLACLGKLFSSINVLKCISYAGYHYINHPNSLTKTASQLTEAVYQGLAWIEIFNFLKANKIKEDEEWIRKRLKAVLVFIKHQPKVDTEHIINYIEQIKLFYLEHFTNDIV